ncbi:MAG TPA: sulfotransferase family protein [Thiolapillus brandeum]|uniref:Sulfotransferase family protein n=1 Tax=Thiolapillus brandeum TaxID=1076588 RepID=A0A831RTI1_9GAMM|nr:sulfotransferase family protein [Thiolapillus brandeum]
MYLCDVMAKKNILLKSHIRKAEELLRQNRVAEAAQVYEKLCRLDGANAGLWVRLSILRRRSGDHGGAEVASRKAIQLSSSSPEAHLALASSLHVQKRLEEAITCYRRAAGLQPDLAEAWYLLANALREAGDLDAAVDTYEQLLRIDSDHFQGLNNYGALLIGMGRSEDAVKLLYRALGLNSSSVETLTNLARAHNSIAAYRVAMELLDKAIALRPDFADAHMEMAQSLYLDGQYDQALVSFDKVIELRPGDARALVGKAKTLEVMGREEESCRLLRPLVEGEAVGAALPVYFDVSEHLGEQDRAVSMIEAFLKSGRANVHGSAPLHFRLGEYYDRRQSFDEAMAHYHKANALGGDVREMETTHELLEGLYRVYDPDRIKDLPCSTLDSQLLVFIVGMPRSGTSLVEQILASHPDIHGLGETEGMEELSSGLSASLSGRAYPDYVPDLSTGMLDEAAAGYIRSVSRRSPSSKRITDKMPHNFLRVGLLLQLFPRCHIIHCRRHPLDTCLSCYFSDFGSNYHDYTRDLQALGSYYAFYSKVMGHWRSVFGNRIFTVDYEELVMHQERESRKMLEYCGMDWSERCLDFHNNTRVVNTISYKQVKQPIYKRSVCRWRNYEKHLEPLRSALEQHGVEY